MTTATLTSLPNDHFYYHGHTVVEQVRCSDGEVKWRHWHLFDSVEDAQAFFFANDVVGRTEA
jgi:succinyl-CoA synthetase alpha subunit